ncbi:NAD-dependent epimerase/dehydratase family protein [Kitasatospora sp. NBC_01266]|uniref:NAD-dependent epimerase/dehydratase family protein n=1 Tax=Kitasatospora sp. NBC_01266 TaxID=2903572 RepID=UPI003FA53770
MLPWQREFVLATERVRSACEEAGVPRLVYASSSSVYGTRSGATPRGDGAEPRIPLRGQQTRR